MTEMAQVQVLTVFDVGEATAEGLVHLGGEVYVTLAWFEGRMLELAKSLTRLLPGQAGQCVSIVKIEARLERQADDPVRG